MNARIESGQLTIIVPVRDLAALPLSASGKSRQVASSGGSQTFTLEGVDAPVKVSVNAYVMREALGEDAIQIAEDVARIKALKDKK